VRVGGVGVIEGLAKNGLRMLGQMRADGRRQIGVDVIRHGHASIGFSSPNALELETVAAGTYEGNQVTEGGNRRRSRAFRR
jgi:hypothetical protein